MTEQKLTVREMHLIDVGIRIDYLHGASDDDLRTLGVDRALLPTPEVWWKFYGEDYVRPIESGSTTRWCGNWIDDAEPQLVTAGTRSS